MILCNTLISNLSGSISDIIGFLDFPLCLQLRELYTSLPGSHFRLLLCIQHIHHCGTPSICTLKMLLILEPLTPVLKAPLLSLRSTGTFRGVQRISTNAVCSDFSILVSGSLGLGCFLSLWICLFTCFLSLPSNLLSRVLRLIDCWLSADTGFFFSTV